MPFYSKIEKTGIHSYHSCKKTREKRVNPLYYLRGRARGRFSAAVGGAEREAGAQRHAEERKKKLVKRKKKLARHFFLAAAIFSLRRLSARLSPSQPPPPPPRPLPSRLTPPAPGPESKTDAARHDRELPRPRAPFAATPASAEILKLNQRERRQLHTGNALESRRRPAAV